MEEYKSRPNIFGSQLYSRGRNQEYSGLKPGWETLYETLSQK
jgi:hypothetical protein